MIASMEIIVRRRACEDREDPPKMIHVWEPSTRDSFALCTACIDEGLQSTVMNIIIIWKKVMN